MARSIAAKNVHASVNALKMLTPPTVGGAAKTCPPPFSPPLSAPYVRGMDKVFIFNLPEIAQKLEADYEVISGNIFKDAARKASPPLTDALAFSIIKNQDGYGFPADKWVRLAVEKLGPVLIVGEGSLAGIDGVTYCGDVEEIHEALSGIGIEVEALTGGEDFSGLFFGEQPSATEDSFDLTGAPEQSAATETNFALPGVDTSPVAGDTGATDNFALPGINTAPNTSTGLAEQAHTPDATPTAILPVTEPELSPLPSPEGSAMPGSVAPASGQSSFDLPGVADGAPGPGAGGSEQQTSAQVPSPVSFDLSPETSQSGYDLPGVDATPDPSSLPGQTGFELPGVNQAPAPEPSPASFQLPTDAIPFSSPTPQGSLYDDIDLSLPEPEEVATPDPRWDGAPGSSAGLAEQYVDPESVPSWGEAPGSNPAPSWEEQPAEHSWRPTSQATEPVRPAPAPPIAPAAIPRTTNGGCPTIIVFGAKGGVGKTTTSIHLAQRAGRLCPDMRITLIDANRGQGDIRTKLRTLNVPTIFDALPEEGRGAIITPPALDKDRPPHLEPLAFALIAAPPSELSDPTQVTPEVYQNALSEARDVSDLVIVDTQISEKYDTTKLFENFLIPLLIKDENIWGVGATEDSPESINNLLERLHQYRARGVKAAKIFTLIAQAHAHNTPEDLRDFEEMFDQASTFAGAVPYNKTIYNRLSSGILCEGLPQVAEPLDRILYAVTGNRVFVAKKAPTEKKKKRRFSKSKTRKPRRR